MQKKMSLEPLKTLLTQADRLQAASPCETRPRADCDNECEWVRGTLYGGTCVDADVFSMFVDRLCSLDEAAPDEAAADFAAQMGYAPRDFGVRAWAQVTTPAVCARLNADADRIQQVADSTQPWRELGMDQATYNDLLRYAQRRYNAGAPLGGIMRGVRARLGGALAAIGTAAAVTTLAMLTLPQSGYAPNTDQMTALAKVPRSVRTVPAQSIIVDDMLPRNPRILRPDMRENSILDKLAQSGLPAPQVKPMSALTTASSLSKEVSGAAQFLDAAAQCTQGTELEARWVQGVLDGLEALAPGANLTQYSDFQNWGLVPGQQLFYGGAFGIPDLTHHAIYVGDGVVLEVGSGPLACKRVRRAMLSFKDQMVGLSTLVNFAERAVKQRSEVNVVVTPEDNDPAVAADRLRRAASVLGCWDYDAVANNCQSAANYISFGIRATAQGDAVLRTARVVVLTAVALAGLLRVWRRTPRKGLEQ